MPFRPGPFVARGETTATLGREGSLALNGGATSGVPANERSAGARSKGCWVESSLEGEVGLARRDPRNFLKRDPSLVEVGDCARAADSCPDATDAERTGIASTLVDAETSFGPEIWLVTIRFR